MKAPVVGGEHQRVARVWLMVCAVLAATAVVAVIGSLPSLSVYPVGILIYLTYGDVLALVLILGAVPLQGLMERLDVPFPARVVAFAVGGSLLAVPFALVGLVADGSAAAWVFGLFAGIVIGAATGVLYPLFVQWQKLATTLGGICLLAGLIGLPFAIGNL
jgi:hypothetical protein